MSAQARTHEAQSHTNPPALASAAGTFGAAPAALGRRAALAPKWVSPLGSYRLTSCYGWRWGRFHHGLDMDTVMGVPVHAAMAGVVVSAGWVHRGYGISVMLAHDGGVKTHYAHLSRATVVRGQRVVAGQRVGLVGNTGHVVSRGGDGSHLHFEVRVGSGSWPPSTNPAPFLRAHGIPVRGC
jgi:murein DD-endopeptidase MepM/ murein hydrolase activator NlpD